MGIILWIVFGAIVGWAASLIMGGGGGLIADIAVGIIGAVIGGYLVSFFGNTGITGFNVYSFLVALLGACVLIFVARAIQSHG